MRAVGLLSAGEVSLLAPVVDGGGRDAELGGEVARSRPPKWCMTWTSRDKGGGHRRSFGRIEDHEGETCDGRRTECDPS